MGAAAAWEIDVSDGRRVEEITLALGPRSYAIVVGAGVLEQVGPRLQRLGFQGRAVVVTSPHVGDLHAAPVVASLRAAGFDPVTLTIPDGEQEKTLSRLSALYDQLLEAGVDRRTPVVALGGGVIGDVVGFAAATTLRGLPLVQVPTTLLAQVDAGIGGKTGVDHARGKNLIGAFYQPRLVVADVAVLATLPARELRAGLAEVVKYGIIGDAGLFAELEARLEELKQLRAEVAVPIVAACARQKGAVVAADEREEAGGRAILNFGHTIGHALETLTGYQTYLHGEAVAIGMVAAARVSRRLGLCSEAVVDRLVALLKRAELPTELPAGTVGPRLVQAMRMDKKSVTGRIRFVAVTEIGRTKLVELSADQIGQQL